MDRAELINRAKELLASGALSKEACDAIKADFPELAESEDERIRKELMNFVAKVKDIAKSGRDSWAVRKEDVEMCERFLAYLEKQKDVLGERAKNITANMLEDGIGGIQRELIEFLSNTVNASWVDVIKSADAYAERIRNIIEKQKEQKGLLRVIKDASEWEKIKEQKPAESDSIKGGDFISDGKRVFLVLANVEERNFGEIGSTFCESLILGVDGVVYCNGDDFKKYKRATSDERAKFIHNLKVGVKLKEQPVEWSEEDNKAIHLASEFIRHHATKGDSIGGIDCPELINRLKSLRPHPHWKPSEEQMNELLNAVSRIATPNKVILDELYRDLKKLM